jgi:NTE family protein
VKNARKALVLAGGGITGIAWEIGVLAGLADLRVDLADADLVIGTSAGSVVGAQLTSGVPVDELYADQLRDPTGEIAARLSPGMLLKWVVSAALPGSDEKARARLGSKAVAAHTVPEAERRAVIESRLPVHTWPARALRITAVDTATGEFRVFDSGSGIELVDAVAASCAVPMVWPPVTIDGHRYMDGGVRSTANVDLAKGYGRVVVLAPSTQSVRRSGRIATQIEALGPHVHHTVVSPSAEARTAMGRNVLDPAFRAASARAGREQAAAVRDAVAVTWGSPPA